MSSTCVTHINMVIICIILPCADYQETWLEINEREASCRHMVVLILPENIIVHVQPYRNRQNILSIIRPNANVNFLGLAAMITFIWNA